MSEFHSEATLFVTGGSQKEYHHYIDATSNLQESPKRYRQSPIDIVTTDCICDDTIKGDHFVINYIPEDFINLKNTGHTWEINLKDDSKSSLQAKHLDGVYRLFKIHCHWGSEPTNGSEHTTDGCGYAGEIHFVHYKMQYENFDEATKHDDGLAVFGVFLEECNDDNPVLQELTEALQNIKFKGQTVRMNSFNAINLIPKNNHFWTYEGSLTTPPCTECVIWTVLCQPIPISSSQLNIFRSLYMVDKDNSNYNSLHLVNNVRPVQQIHNRRVRASFAK